MQSIRGIFLREFSLCLSQHCFYSRNTINVDQLRHFVCELVRSLFDTAVAKLVQTFEHISSVVTYYRLSVSCRGVSGQFFVVPFSVLPVCFRQPLSPEPDDTKKNPDWPGETLYTLPRSTHRPASYGVREARPRPFQTCTFSQIRARHRPVIQPVFLQTPFAETLLRLELVVPLSETSGTRRRIFLLLP